MTINFSNLGVSANPDINDPNDAASYSNSSWTPPTSGLILLFVFSRASSGTTNEPSVSGNSITWTKIGTSINGTTRRITLFAANAAGSSTGATTVDFGGQGQLFCRASFFLAEGVDLSGGVASAFVQTVGNNGTGTSGSISLSAASHSSNRPISGFGHAENEGKTPRTNWTEVDDITGSFPVNSIETQYRGDAFETTASATWTASVPWAGIAAELKALVGTLYTMSVDGGVSPSGDASKQTSKNLGGNATLTGLLNKFTSKGFGGELIPSGEVSYLRIFVKSLEGAVTFAGGLIRDTQKNLEGNVTPIGTIYKGISKFFAGTLNFLGTIFHFIAGDEPAVPIEYLLGEVETSVRLDGISERVKGLAGKK